jgi:hypothetical protein
MILYAFTDDSDGVMNEFRTMVEKRLLKICIKAYFPLFKGLSKEKKEGLS